MSKNEIFLLTSSNILTNMNHFTYNQLQVHDRQIRLLLLLPGLDRERISCKLITVFLNDNPEYSALSYTWGDPNVKEPILVNEQEFPVTTNLTAALWHLRLATRARLLWVDAICINQVDIPERNRQVQMMRNIYANAGKVLVWLGEPTEESSTAIHLLEDLSGLFKDQNIFNPDAESISADADLWRPVTNLFRRPFWSRGWIIQEIALARQVIFFCGRRSISWLMLDLALCSFIIRLNHTHLGYRNEVYQRIISLKLERQDWSTPGIHIRFPDLLHKQRLYREVSDPRDIIYSMVGLAKDISPGLIEPDYSQPVQLVYRNSTRSIIEGTGCLDILGHVMLHLNMSRRHYPSWVRDWRKYSFVVPFFKGRHGQNFYQASRNSGVIITPSENLDILIVEGFHYDSVAQVSALAREDIFRKDVCSWRETAKIDHERPPLYISGRNRFDAFWRTLIANQDFRSNGGYFIKRPAEKERQVAEMILGLRHYEYSKHQESIDSFMLEIELKSKYRKMIFTQKGYLGLAPPETMKDDIVCVLLGGNMPFILRPKGSYYTFIGECYVHGIMDGEVLDAAQTGLIQPQKFSLL
jgi:hypothetical protein